MYLIQGSMWMVNLKELEDMYGQMESFMKVNGSMEWNMVQECGKVLKETRTLDNGNLVKQMDMEFMYGSMEIDMKEILNNV